MGEETELLRLQLHLETLDPLEAQTQKLQAGVRKQQEELLRQGLAQQGRDNRFLR
jgi:hypothetical protein